MGYWNFPFTQRLGVKHINFLYTCLSAKITSKFESNSIKLHKSLCAESGRFKYVGVHDRALRLNPAWTALILQIEMKSIKYMTVKDPANDEIPTINKKTQLNTYSIPSSHHAFLFESGKLPSIVNRCQDLPHQKKSQSNSYDCSNDTQHNTYDAILLYYIAN